MPELDYRYKTCQRVGCGKPNDSPFMLSRYCVSCSKIIAERNARVNGDQTRSKKRMRPANEVNGGRRRNNGRGSGS